LGIQHDADQRPAAIEPATVGEHAVVGQHGSDAGKNGVGVVAQQLYVGAGRFASDPAAVVVRGGDLPIQGDSGLDEHERPPVRMKCTNGSLIDSASAAYSLASATSTPAAARRRKPSPATRGLGSSMAATTLRTPAAMSASVQGAGAPLVAAGLQANVQGGPRAASPASSSATISACFWPAYVWKPSPTTAPSRSSTAPTAGFGLVRPAPWRARSNARRM